MSPVGETLRNASTFQVDVSRQTVCCQIAGYCPSCEIKCRGRDRTRGQILMPGLFVQQSTRSGNI